MKHYRESVIGRIDRRNKFLDSKEVASFSFKEKNKYLEHWAGMYLFEDSNPTEESFAYGNFYLEIDEEDFFLLKEKTLFIISMLEKRGVRRCDLTLSSTNRSIWISVPAKIFGTYKMKNLHLIHKEMAKEINMELVSSFEGNGLDMSIYRWNGLTRMLGSFLKKSKCRVMKVEVQDVENAVDMDSLRRSNYDSFGSYSDFKVSLKAKKWFFAIKKRISLRSNKKTSLKKQVSLKMEEFIENGELPFNRNLHIYSISLYLKGKGLNFKEALSLIQSKIKDAYVFLPEALRTVASAFKGSKEFSNYATKEYLDSSIFEDNFSTEDLDTFIIPRQFIKALNSKKVHVNVYKLLILILKNQQVDKESFKLSLSEDKYKKLTLSYFEKLTELGFISYVYNRSSKEVSAKLNYQEYSFYKNFFVLPISFLETEFFTESKREFIVLMELLRSSYSFEELKFYTNIKVDTLNRNLKMSPKTIETALSRFEELGLVNGKVYSLNALESRLSVLEGTVDESFVKLESRSQEGSVHEPQEYRRYERPNLLDGIQNVIVKSFSPFSKGISCYLDIALPPLVKE